MATSSDFLTLDQRDREAVAAVLAGNPDAFVPVVNRYTDQLFRLAYATLRDTHDAEEAVQDIFLKTYRRLDSFDPARRFHPWIYAIAVNHLRSLWRKARRSLDRDALSLAEELIPSDNPGTNSQPEAELLASATRDLLRRALGRLSPVQREAFTLRHLRGLSTGEAANILGIPENTLKTHLRRARMSL